MIHKQTFAAIAINFLYYKLILYTYATKIYIKKKGLKKALKEMLIRLIY